MGNKYRIVRHVPHSIFHFKYNTLILMRVYIQRHRIIILLCMYTYKWTLLALHDVLK